MPLMEGFTDEEEQAKADELMEELLDLDESLSNWERDFLQSLSEWEGNFTYGQFMKIKELHRNHFN